MVPIFTDPRFSGNARAIGFPAERANAPLIDFSAPAQSPGLLSFEVFLKAVR
jgi:hypothetical protein